FDLRKQIGTVTANTASGIFGALDEPVSGAALPVASAKQISTGKAEIWCNVDGKTVLPYAVQIDRIYPLAGNGRNLMLTVTDERLLEVTGGIVQGMSGSPIVQDGKLIGAVTHVLVNDPTRGYGIFIEKMLDADR
ncbi:MAG: SpoIVB peptidase S55 domain-containing protein, partial [Oscillospiraceae bacterium]|nr:SpoIVB peptidase S55 domain-containing protein [Oscillospiraceae bacterium]